jgi:ectoine hydroxylase-related dioxygenase (phytanoyl-CoA dioxygenase family)
MATGREGTMATERTQFFRDHGWLKIDNVFTREEVDQVRRELLKLAEQGHNARNLAMDSGSRRRKREREATPGAKPEFTAQVCEPSRLNPFLREFATSKKIGALMREVMDVPRIRLYRDMALIKAPESDNRGTALHQDQVYFPIDRRGLASLWIALDDLPANSGTVRFVDGSHKWGPVGREHFPIDKWLAEHPEQADLLTPPQALKAGSVTIHDGYTLHGADANTWNQSRIAHTIVYCCADALFNGMPAPHTDGLGLKQDEPFEHEFFPIVE